MRLSAIPMLFLCLSLHAQNFVWGHSPPAVAPGGIAIVSVTTNYLAGNGTSLSTTIPATAAGDCIVALVNNYHSHVSSFTTNGVAATFQITTNCYIGGSGTYSYLEGWILPNSGAAVTTVGITTTADGVNPGFITPTIVVVRGLNAAPYTATERMASPNGGTVFVNTQDTGGQISNGTANSIYFAALGGLGGGILTTINSAGTDGTWIEPPNSRQTGAIAQEMEVVYQIVSSSSARKYVGDRMNTANATIGIEFVLHQ